LHNRPFGLNMFVNFCGIASLLLIVVPFFKGALAVTKTYGLSLDVNSQQLLSTDTFSCMKNASYAVVFVQMYGPENGGAVVSHAKDNIFNALNVKPTKLGVEVYVQPNVSFATAKSPEQQFDESRKYMDDNVITFGTVWLVVTQPTSWSKNAQTNIDFINRFLARARAAKHYVGIYTNWYDWYLITNQYKGVQTNGTVLLWYWNTLGIGSSAVSSRDFSDFRQFGGWRYPAVKQFGIVEDVCGVTVNRNTYVNGTSAASSSKKAFASNKQQQQQDRHFRLVFKPNRLDKLVQKVNADGSVQLSAVVGHNFNQA